MEPVGKVVREYRKSDEYLALDRTIRDWRGSVVVEPFEIDGDLRAYYSREVQRIFIESNSDLLEWKIYHTSGVKVHQENADVSMNRASYPASHLPKGVYIVKVRTVDNVETTKKVLVN